jgi:hypothetical protein
MSLNQIRQATLASLEDGDLEPEEARGILAAIDRQIAAGRDPDMHHRGIIDLDRLPSPEEVLFEQLAIVSRKLAAGSQPERPWNGRRGIGAVGPKG